MTIHAIRYAASSSSAWGWPRPVGRKGGGRGASPRRGREVLPGIGGRPETRHREIHGGRPAAAGEKTPRHRRPPRRLHLLRPDLRRRLATRSASGAYDVVVILGTNHTAPDLRKIALYPGGGFRTPLGTAPVDGRSSRRLSSPPRPTAPPTRGRTSANIRSRSRSPSSRSSSPRQRSSPAIVGEADAALCTRFGTALASVLKGRRALIVASSDLSHYPSAADAETVDMKTLAAVATLDPAALHDDHPDADGPAHSEPLHLRLRRGPHHGRDGRREGDGGDRGKGRELRPLRGISPSASGSASSATGRSSWPPIRKRGPRRAAGCGNGAGRAHRTRRPERPARPRPGDDLPLPDDEDGPPAAAFQPHPREPRGVFVTLKKRGDLRGCIGRMVPDRPLADLVGAMALQSAFEDPRFSPVTLRELADLEIEISVLTPMKPVSGPERHRRRPGRRPPPEGGKIRRVSPPGRPGTGMGKG